MQNKSTPTAHYHLPGLFEFYELYKVFLPIWCTHREWFYSWCDIGSVYGAPADCLWGGGRAGFGEARAEDVLALMNEYGISSRLTFSNSLLRKKHLSDRKCNELCRMFEKKLPARSVAKVEVEPVVAEHCRSIETSVQNGVIVHSDLLSEYLKANYPSLYLIFFNYKSSNGF